MNVQVTNKADNTVSEKALSKSYPCILYDTVRIEEIDTALG